MDDFNFQNQDQNQDLNQNPVQYQDQYQNNNMVIEQYNNQYNDQFDNQMNNQEQPNNSSNNNKKFNFNFNKKSTIILGSIGGAVVVCIIAIIILLNSINNPKKTFAKVLEVVKTEYKSKIEKISKDSLKHEISITSNFEYNEGSQKNNNQSDDFYGYHSSDYYQPSGAIFAYLNGMTYNVALQYDEKNNYQLDYELKSSAESMAQSMYYNSDNKEYYVKVKDFKDKWVKYNDNSFEITDEIISQVKESMQNKKTEYIDIVFNEVLKELSNKSIESGKETITVDGQNINANKSSLKLSERDIANITNKVALNLKENEEFKKIFETTEYADKMLDYIIEDTDVSKNQDISNEVKYEIDVYTKGFINQEFIGVTFKLLNEDLYRLDYRYSNNKHEINFAYGWKDTELNVNCVINVTNDNNFNSDIVINYKESGGNVYIIKLHVDYTITQDVDMDTITKNNSITVENLTEQDFYDYMKKYPDEGDYRLHSIPFYSDFLEKNSLEYNENTKKFNKYNKKASVFNEEYEAYMGKYMTAANTKALLQKVKTHNTLAETEADSENYRTIYIYVNGNYYKPTDIIKEITSQQHYCVNTKEYDDEGYIKSIEIAIAQEN